jgi:hypothetical protein
VEAELQFSCMDPEEYDRQLQQEEEDDDEEEEDQYDPQQTHATSGTGMIPDENTDPDDDGFFGMFGADEDDDEEEDDNPGPPPPRAFLKLWTAVAQWVTPEAVQYVVGGGAMSSPVPAKSDIEMSRCIALMNLLRLHLNNNNNNYDHPHNHQHQQQQPHHHQQEEAAVVDNDLAQRQRVGELLRRFDYRQPSPSLDTSLVKALACILWDMVSWPVRPTTKEEDETTTTVPPVCAAVGLSIDEYRYLVRSSIRNFRQDETMCVSSN